MLTLAGKGSSVCNLFFKGELPLAADLFILDLRTTHFDGAITGVDTS